VTDATDLASAINRVMPDGPRGSLVVFGDWFGRPYDNTHTLVAAEAYDSPQRIRMTFDEGETLDVWQPGGAVLRLPGLLIATAAKVRWEWFYYGRSHVPENRFFIEHVCRGGTVTVTTDATWAPKVFKAAIDQSAVELRTALTSRALSTELGEHVEHGAELHQRVDLS
jgi:hypothetical protein